MLEHLNEERIREALGLSFPYFAGRTIHLPPTAGVGVVLRGVGADCELLLIRRQGSESDPASQHPGQIAFPGGKVDPSDQGSSRTAAIRELEEEVGIRIRSAELGVLPRILTGSSAHVLEPVVFYLPEVSVPLRLNAAEVAEANWVQLRELTDPSVRSREWLERRGASAPEKIEAPVFDLRKRLGPSWRVWGATAFVIENLLARIERRLTEAHDPS